MEKRVVGDDKKEGGEGQPCLTPLETEIQIEGKPPKKGATLTSAREPRRKFINQSGTAALAKTCKIQS